LFARIRTTGHLAAVSSILPRLAPAFSIEESDGAIQNARWLKHRKATSHVIITRNAAAASRQTVHSTQTSRRDSGIAPLIARTIPAPS
jgi:hypothetical protein